MTTGGTTNTPERDALSLSLPTGNQTSQDASKSRQAVKKAASLKASTMTPRGFRAISGNITPWMPDVTKCHVCEVKFTIFNHRHNCRKCQEPVCHQCSRARKVLRRYTPPKRVCDTCISTFWAIKAREPDAAATATTDSKNCSSDTRKTGGDSRPSLTVSAPSSSALAGGMYASHTASLSPGTPAAAFFGPNTTDMNRGRRRLGSTSVESCLSLATPSMLPPPTPAGGEGGAAVAPLPQEEEALSSPVILKEEESGTFFGGRRESCGGGKVETAAAASLLVADQAENQSVMAAVSAGVLAAEAEAAAAAAASSSVVVSKEEDVKVEAMGMEATSFPPDGSVGESESGTSEEVQGRGAEKGEMSQVVCEETKLEAEGIHGEGDADVTEKEELAPVASVAASLAGSVVGDEPDDIEGSVVDDEFVVPTVSAVGAAALAEAVSAAATEALLPAVLDEPAPESMAVAAAAAVTVSVEANKSKGGETAAAPADVVMDNVAEDDGGNGKDDGGSGGGKRVKMKTLACYGAVAFGVGLAVAVLVRWKS